MRLTVQESALWKLCCIEGPVTLQRNTVTVTATCNATQTLNPKVNSVEAAAWFRACEWKGQICFNLHPAIDTFLVLAVLASAARARARTHTQRNHPALSMRMHGLN